MSNVAIIVARGGSTRIPRKNLRPFFGKPIMAYSIEAAIASRLFDNVIVSTDDDEIAEIAQQFDADVMKRPDRLAQNEIGTQEVMAHAMTIADGYDMACCIYPTAPMMTPADLIRGWQRLHAPGTVYTMSVGTDPLQDAGQWYWGHSWAFREGVKLIEPHTAMIPIPFNRVIDINTQEDWDLAESMYLAWRENTCKEWRTE